eukprot:GHVH01006571.1.p1 GENE.GHVH01006571.1~~GHVH01006571.1.p1  ORF type:complete len:272 (+),score=53.71 GHVH01006571.1:69-884(+)
MARASRLPYKEFNKTLPSTEEREVKPIERSAEELAPVKAHPLMEKVSHKKPVGKCVTPAHQKNLNRYVRWPRYIRVQRQKSILIKRMKVPPSIAQFSATLDKNQSTAVFKLLESIKPMSKVERRTENRAIAEARASGKVVEPTVNRNMVFGMKEVTSAIESGRAKMVIIAHDVDPIETVIYLPALCRKLKIPYAFIKGKAALGRICHQKNVTSVAVLSPKPEHKSTFGELCSSFLSQYNDNIELRRTWGGGIMNKAFYKRQEELAKLAKSK